jgi:hypothetical protein
VGSCSLAIDMTGQTVAGWRVVRRVPTVARLARFLCKHTCGAGGERYIEGSTLRSARAPRHCGPDCQGAPATDGLQRCPQCNDKKPWPQAFIGRRGKPIGWCTECVELYRTNGGTRATRRRKIDAEASTRVLWVPRSMDRKLGGIPATYSAGSTCPDACALKDQGCYAEFGKLGHHWSRVSERGLAWPDLLFAVACLPDGTLWRHNIAGDLQGTNDELDVRALLDLVLVNEGKRGFSFTHKPLRRARERLAVRLANARGFTINLSADTLEHADARAELGVGPVAVTLPSDAPPHLRTPAGRHVVLCPAETRGLTCSSCELCAQPQRKAVVGFRAHGQWSAKIDGRLRLPVIQEAAS